MPSAPPYIAVSVIIRGESHLVPWPYRENTAEIVSEVLTALWMANGSGFDGSNEIVPEESP